ncbi:MAG: hypothetical protein NTV06_01405 [candidate division Zixibacteria bacterium]|nr:hypothetical protein [candidate division Zixibacteria bacterium]
MQNRIRYLRTISLVLLIAYVHAVFLPSWLYAQTPNCNYDIKAPSIENARRNFKALNYKCAELELTDLLGLPNLSLEDKSNVHILLAAVYYAMLKDDSEKKNMVMQQFMAAFKAYRDWKGELDIKSPEFKTMMEQAQLQVDKETSIAPAEQKATIDTTAHPAAMTGTKAGKAWYKQWWAIGLGVGIVAGAVILVAGGKGDAAVPDTALAGFPSHPE